MNSRGTHPQTATRRFRDALPTLRVLCLLLFGMSSVAFAQYDAAIDIDEALWTDRVDSRSRTYSTALGQSATVKSLFLWTRIKGKRLALDQLEREGKLPIRHKWPRRTVLDLVPEGVSEPVNNIAIPEARAERLQQQLQAEVGARGYFDWRTWSGKANVRPRMWKVKAFDQDAVALFADESIDVHYIDSIHTYESVKGTVTRWVPKIRRGGVVSRHDFCSVHWGGVVAVVREMFGAPDEVLPDTSWVVVDASARFRTNERGFPCQACRVRREREMASHA